MDDKVALVKEIIFSVRESHRFTLEQAAELTGYGTTSIHYYESGERRVPVDYLRRLFEKTRDPRIIKLIDPYFQPCMCNVGDEASETPKRTPPPSDPRTLVHKDILATQEHLIQLGCLERMLRDNKIDATDDMIIAEYLERLPKLIEHMQQTAAAVVVLRQQNQDQQTGVKK